MIMSFIIHERKGQGKVFEGCVNEERKLSQRIQLEFGA